MKDIVKGTFEAGKFCEEIRTRALRAGDYYLLARAEEVLLHLKLSADRIHILEKIIGGK